MEREQEIDLDGFMLEIKGLLASWGRDERG